MGREFLNWRTSQFDFYCIAAKGGTKVEKEACPKWWKRRARLKQFFEDENKQNITKEFLEQYLQFKCIDIGSWKFINAESFIFRFV